MLTNETQITLTRYEKNYENVGSIQISYSFYEHWNEQYTYMCIYWHFILCDNSQAVVLVSAVLVFEHTKFITKYSKLPFSSSLVIDVPNFIRFDLNVLQIHLNSIERYLYLILMFSISILFSFISELVVINKIKPTQRLRQWSNNWPISQWIVV